ncbi:MAG: HAMP domain-containing protein [Synechococcales cyanobacterium CRU_2_2]|nr:HAMP domain-containing protein [Synechococcales cyanobacterium CRU_2_2]
MPLEVDSTDEVGSLAIAFNQMSANFNASTDCMEQLVTQNEQEVEAQRQEAERLQKRVMELLLEIDGARQGNLTVRARVTDDEMGSVADAFNSTVASLQGLVLQVQEVASQVNQKVAVSDQSVGALADVATQQARSMTEALQSVKEMSISIEGVAATASQAASISRRASAAADAGGEAMEQTVLSINGLRGSVAETAKKVKRLTESSQEISKIVGLISEVSAKTNLLAFNASIEAVRAGEHGQGFRIVADEVRRLAEQVTHATQEIEQLVTGIQLETAEVLTMMEQGTEQVVTGSELVDKTRTTLASLVQTNQEIDGLLQSISASTASQTAASAAVGETMQSVAILAQGSSEESVAVSEMLRQLLTVSNQLQHSVKQFQAQPS